MRVGTFTVATALLSLGSRSFTNAIKNVCHHPKPFTCPEPFNRYAKTNSQDCFTSLIPEKMVEIATPENFIGRGSYARVYNIPDCPDDVLRIKHTCSFPVDTQMEAIPFEYPPDIKPNPGLGLPSQAFVNKNTLPYTLLKSSPQFIQNMFKSKKPSAADSECFMLMNKLTGSHPDSPYRAIAKKLSNDPLHPLFLEFFKNSNPTDYQAELQRFLTSSIESSDKIPTFQARQALRYKLSKYSPESRQAFYKKYEQFAEAYTKQVAKLASLEQFAYDKLVSNLKAIQKAGYKLDLDHPANILVDTQKQNIGLIDISFDPDYDPSSSSDLSRLVEVLLGSQHNLNKPWMLVQDPKYKNMLRNHLETLIKKMRIATQKYGIDSNISIKCDLLGF